MKKSLSLILFICVILIIFFGLYMNRCDRRYQQYLNIFKSNSTKATVTASSVDKFKNRKFIKTKEEIELTKLNPIIDANECGHGQISIFIETAADTQGQSDKKRNILRKTSGFEAKHQHNINVYFLIGLSHNQTVNQLISTEANEHGDVIQFQFYDDYRNLTLKTISMLRWAQRQCSNTKFVMKVDDDIILNIERLLKVIKTFESGITGHRVHPRRQNKEGFPGYINPKYYPITDERYPPYVYGGAYILSSDIIESLITATDNYSGYYLDNEDLFLTGIIAGIAGVQSYDTQDIYLPFNCDLNHLSNMSSLIALGDCQSNEQFLNFWYHWKPPTNSCSNYSLVIIVLTCFIFIFSSLEFIKNICVRIRRRNSMKVIYESCDSL